MGRSKLRSQTEVITRSEELREEVRTAAGRLPSADDAVIDDVWIGEALGTLLWALQLADLPAYDTAFDRDAILDLPTGEAALRPGDELEQARESARLWHWRARTTDVQAAGGVELPDRFASFDQLIAATAMRGHELGVLPPPLRGDFQAFGKVYRHLSPSQQAEAHSIAVERHHALNWLAGLGDSWDDVPLET